MNKPTRRTFVKAAAAVAAGLSGCAKTPTAPGEKKDVRIESVSCGYEEFAFRTPLKFALAVVNRQTMLTVNCTVRTAAGKVATGFGTLPLNYIFTFPSRKLSEQARLGAMKALAEELVKVTGEYKEYGHPIDANWDLTPAYLEAAADVSRRLRLAEPIPKLCTLVTARAFDAAIHA